MLQVVCSHFATLNLMWYACVTVWQKQGKSLQDTVKLSLSVFVVQTCTWTLLTVVEFSSAKQILFGLVRVIQLCFGMRGEGGNGKKCVSL